MRSARSRRILTSCAVVAGVALAAFVGEPASAWEPTARRQQTAAWTASTPIRLVPVSNATLDQLIQDGSFEAGIPNPFWGETSTNFGTPLCDVGGCGTGGGTALPRTGLIWAWFGGIPAPETATLSQSVTIPTGVSAILTFWMRIGAVSSPFTDVLSVKVDGTAVETYPEPSVAEGAYTLRTIDLSAYANGAAHTVLFEYIGTTTGNANFVVDDVELNTTPLPSPMALTVDAAGNRVMEPAETVVVAPSWRNNGTATQTGVTGTASAFTGPSGATYTINDASASYGDIAAGATATCTTDCYGMTATATAGRPVQHWDTTFQEELSVGGQKTWTLHVGGSFTDVADTSPFYRFVETLLHESVTGGCGTGIYCPLSSTSREQMAVFVLLAKEGAGYTPAACAPPNLFTDVPETSPFCRFIEELATRGVVSGCGTGLYCPTAAVTRDTMAIFVLRTLDPAINPPACVAGSEMFTDVPATSPFCRWVEELARRGVVSGCGPNLYCPADPVTREQMGVFLSATFGLTLYGI